MQELLRQNLRTYTWRHQLQLTEQLGFGIHGIVHVAEDNIDVGKRALKAHSALEPYCRERDVYLRLRDAGITQMAGFHVPQLVRFDDQLRIIEMTVVTRPFVLDFAGAYLDTPPDFPDEVWTQWEEDKREQFGSRWPEVLKVLAALEDLNIHMIDVSPSNIAF